MIQDPQRDGIFYWYSDVLCFFLLIPSKICILLKHKGHRISFCGIFIFRNMSAGYRIVTRFGDGNKDFWYNIEVLFAHQRLLKSQEKQANPIGLGSVGFFAPLCRTFSFLSPHFGWRSEDAHQSLWNGHQWWAADQDLGQQLFLLMLHSDCVSFWVINLF